MIDHAHDQPFDLRALKTANAQQRLDEWAYDWGVQWDLFQDRGRVHVQERARELKLGIKNDRAPFEASLLRYVVQSLSVVYRSPPVRRLVDSGQQVDELDPRHDLFTSALQRSSFDAFTRQMEQHRVLFGQVFVRLYPSDISRKVKPVLFGPMSVLRDPDPGEPDNVQADRRIALERADGRYEFWERTVDGWTMRLLDKRGDPLPDALQSFAATEYVSPYQVLPIVVAYDGLPVGPWIPPKTSRTSYPLNISSLFNEVMSGIRWDSHPEVMYTQAAATPGQRPVSPNEVPRATGPGLRNLLPPGVSPELLNISPQVEPALKAIDKAVEMFLRSESLPVDAYQRSQSVTALGLKTMAQPLIERQESLRPFAYEVEQALFSAYWAVHSVHAPGWGQATLDEGLGLDVQFGPVDVAQDAIQLSQVLSRDLALGLISTIDAIQVREGCSRDEAIKRYARVAEDRERYPVLTTPAAEADDGPANADPDPDASDLNPAASVIDSVRQLNT